MYSFFNGCEGEGGCTNAETWSQKTATQSLNYEKNSSRGAAEFQKLY